ncbi:hypothetical protein PG993_006253 [Apiospora rasikravindrae]|uniref:B box-type domain-containing protein n=1 Tax=Apiospora rasikravindrae TaxID=990691 RepID=A0ABR1T568_9PEZI
MAPESLEQQIERQELQNISPPQQLQQTTPPGQAQTTTDSTVPATATIEPLQFTLGSQRASLEAFASRILARVKTRCISLWSALDRLWDGWRNRILAVIAVLGFLLTVLAIWPSISAASDGHRALLLAEWTARKDFIEACEATGLATNSTKNAPENGKRVWVFFLYNLYLVIRHLLRDSSGHSNSTYQENETRVMQIPATTTAASKVNFKVPDKTTRKRPQESTLRDGYETESQRHRTSTPVTDRAGHSSNTHQENEKPVTRSPATTPATSQVNPGVRGVRNKPTHQRPRKSAHSEWFKPESHGSSAPTKGPEASNRSETSGVSAGRDRAPKTASGFSGYLKVFEPDKSSSTPSDRQTSDPVRQNKVPDPPSQHTKMAGTAKTTATSTTTTQDPVRHYAATYSPLNYKSKTPSKAGASAARPGTSDPKNSVWFCVSNDVSSAPLTTPQLTVLQCQCGNGPMTVPVNDYCTNCDAIRCADCTVEISKKPKKKQKGQS